MFCKNCGNQIIDGENTCRSCGNIQNNESNVNQNEKKDDTKVYKILAYIGILWLVGLFCSKKDDKSVRFHVGQGIINTIFIAILYVVVTIINNLVIANMFKEASIFGLSIISPTGLAIMGFLNFAVSAVGITLEIIGIVNAVKGQDKELPVIGSHAFYR